MNNLLSMDPFIRVPDCRRLILQHLRREIVRLTEVSTVWNSRITKSELGDIKITVNTEDSFETVMKSDRKYQNIAVDKSLPEILQLDLIQRFASSIVSLEVNGMVRSATSSYQKARQRILSLLYSDSTQSTMNSFLTNITSLQLNGISANFFKVLSPIIGYKLRSLSILNSEVASETIVAFLKCFPNIDELTVSDLGFMQFSDEVQLKLKKFNFQEAEGDQSWSFNTKFKETIFWKSQAGTLKSIAFLYRDLFQERSSSLLLPRSLRISTVRKYFKITEARYLSGLHTFNELEEIDCQLQEIISRMTVLEDFKFEAGIGKIIYRKIDEAHINSYGESLLYSSDEPEFSRCI